jgi:hypothetical protein
LFITSGRSPFTLGQENVSMQKRRFVFVPTHLAEASYSSQISFLFELAYHCFRHFRSTSEQYSPSIRIIPAGHEVPVRSSAASTAGKPVVGRGAGAGAEEDAAGAEDDAAGASEDAAGAGGVAGVASTPEADGRGGAGVGAEGTAAEQATRTARKPRSTRRGGMILNP